MEPASLQVLGRKQKEGHRVWTLGPARECPGAAELGRVMRECSCCSPCVDTIGSRTAAPPRAPGTAGPGSSTVTTGSLWKPPSFCYIFSWNVFGELQDAGQGQFSQGSRRRGQCGAGLMPWCAQPREDIAGMPRGADAPAAGAQPPGQDSLPCNP